MEDNSNGRAIIGEIRSSVQVFDSQALLQPQVMERIVQTVLARVKEHDRHQAALTEERKMRPSMTAREASTWEG